MPASLLAVCKVDSGANHDARHNMANLGLINYIVKKRAGSSDDEPKRRKIYVILFGCQPVAEAFSRRPVCSYLFQINELSVSMIHKKEAPVTGNLSL